MLPGTEPLRPIREQRQARAGDSNTDHSLESYADRLGISHSQLSRIERGLVDSLPVDLAWGIHRVYGVPLRAFDRGVGKAA